MKVESQTPTRRRDSDLTAVLPDASASNPTESHLTRRVLPGLLIRRMQFSRASPETLHVKTRRPRHFSSALDAARQFPGSAFVCARYGEPNRCGVLPR